MGTHNERRLIKVLKLLVKYVLSGSHVVGGKYLGLKIFISFNADITGKSNHLSYSTVCLTIPSLLAMYGYI